MGGTVEGRMGMKTWLWVAAGLAAIAAAIVLLAPPASAWTAGPDACGYTALDNQELNGPLYDFTDITATGTPATQAAWNDGSEVVPLPFPFKFCGTEYTDVTLVSNGFLCFGASTPCDPYMHYPDPVPSAWNPAPAIYGYFSDLSPFQCGANMQGIVRVNIPVPCVLWEVQGTAPNRVFIYMEKDVPFARSCGRPFCAPWAYPVASLEIKLFESSNCAEVHIEEAADTIQIHQGLVGMQEDGATGLQYAWGNPAPSEAGVAVQYCQTVIPPPLCTPAFQTANIAQAVNAMVVNGNPPYSWSAPGGTPSSAAGPGQSFTTSYAATGTYTITVTDALSNSSTCTVDVPPTSCSPATQTVFTGSPATLTGIGGNGAYAWSAPGGTPSSSTGPTFAPTYVAIGTHTVTVTSGGASGTCTVVVTAGACGYTITNPAPYDFVDIMATGTSAAVMGAAGDDDYETHPLNLAAGPNFDFEFCGVNYTDASLSSNGYICFVLTNGCINNGWGPTSWWSYWWSSPLPDPAQPLAVVYGYGTDLVPPDCVGAGPNCVKYQLLGAAPHRTFVYEFKDVPLYDQNTGGPDFPGATFEIKLHEDTDCVEVQYQAVQDPTGDHASVAGFQDATGTAAWEYAFSPLNGGGWSRALTAWMACPPPKFAAWDDEVSFNEDQPAQAIDVLANDVAAGGGPLAVVGHTQPSHGALTFAGGVLSYAPAPDFTGSDSFDYTIENATGGRSTATVLITVNPVNDAPSFAAGPALLFAPETGAAVVPGWATAVAPGPAAATDEAVQAVTFELVSDSNPALFATPPSLYRTGSAGATLPANPPTAGAFAALRVEPSGGAGTARLCFRARDDGGTATAWTVGLSPPSSATGVDAGAPLCVDVTENAAPVAYFEPSTPQAEPGQAVRFDSCPSPLPLCSHDPDGTIVEYAWELGDGAAAHDPMPVHAYARVGTYVVRLTVRDDSGATASYVRALTVGMPAQAPVDDLGSGSDLGPLADAGPDVAVHTGDVVRLQGAERGGRSDVAFLWSQEAGPAVRLDDPTAASPTFKAPQVPGPLPVQLLFALRVQAGAAASPPDYAVVTVSPPGHAPVADAGRAQVATVGSRVTLASASADADGDPLTYLWEQVEGPPVALDGATGPAATFSAPAAPATLAFRLTVRDGAWSSQDTTVVHVVPAEAAPADPSAPDAVAAREPARAAPTGLILIAGAALLALAAVLVAVQVVRRVR